MRRTCSNSTRIRASADVIDMPAHDGADIAKVLYIGDPADLAVVAEQMRVRFGDALYVTYSLPDCLEVMTANVSKGRALRSVLARLGVDTGHCIAFGDNMNDIDLLETAGHAFMMNNANPSRGSRTSRGSATTSMRASPATCARCSRSKTTSPPAGAGMKTGASGAVEMTCLDLLRQREARCSARLTP